MTLIDKILKNTYLKETVVEDLGKIDASELSDVQKAADAVNVDAGSSYFFNVVAKPYGTGFKLIIKPNDSGLTNLENGLDEKFERELGWEKIDTDELLDGTRILYYR